MKKKRTWIIIGIIAIVITIGLVVITQTRSNATASQSTNTQAVTVTRTTLFTSVDSTGSLLPESTLELSFGTSGTVDQVNVEPGDQVKQGDWVASLKRFREPLGSLVSRAPARVDFTKSLRGAPDGDYAIIHFTTSFTNKSVTERLTLVKEGEKWQVAAYAIH